MFNAAGASSGLKVACLRLPCFPLQWLYRKRPELRGRRLAWLEQLKPEAPLRYLSIQAKNAGLQVGMRYATALGLAPDLVAGSCDEQALARMEAELLRDLSCFSPEIRRAGSSLQGGLYLLDVKGLTLAFKGMENWARGLLKRLRQKRWLAALAMGFTNFGCEIATYSLSARRPWIRFRDSVSEQHAIMDTPMTAFELDLEGMHRLDQLKIRRLSQFLALEVEDVRRRLGPELLELYFKASDALFSEPKVLARREPFWEQQNFLYPTGSLDSVLAKAMQIVRRLLPRLIERGEGVSALYLWLATENGERLRQCVRLCSASIDLSLLEKLLRLRLERSFQNGLSGLNRLIEQIAVVVIGEPEREEQKGLFEGWRFSGDERPPRDRRSAMLALSCLRAKYGDSCLRRALILDHNLPGRNFSWQSCLEQQLERSSRSKYLNLKPKTNLSQPVAKEFRVRRWLSCAASLPDNDCQPSKDGPFLYSGDWWEQEPFERSDFYVRQEEQVLWIYLDHLKKKRYVQGWLQ